MDDNEFGVVEGSLGGRPSRSRGRRGGLAYADHDPLDPSVFVGWYNHHGTRDVMQDGAQHV